MYTQRDTLTIKKCSPCVLAVGGDVSSSTTLGAEGGVGDTPWFCVLPRAKNPTGGSTIQVHSAGGSRDMAWVRGVGGALGDGPPVIVLSQGSVESGQLSQLHLTKVVLVLGRLDALLQDVANLHTVHTNSSKMNVTPP